jgi:DNA-binding response OmpR family regulator
MNVLFVESGGAVGASLASFVRAQRGWSADIIPAPVEALCALGHSSYEVVFIGWCHTPPAWDGLGLCRAIRAQSPSVGRIFLSATAALKHRLAAFDAGADDYLETACDPIEVLARASAVARRARPPSVAGQAPRRELCLAPDLVADEYKRVVTGPTGQVELTPTEIQLLARLADGGSKKGVSTCTLAIELLARNDEHALNLVHRHVSNVRRKLRKIGAIDVLGRSRDGYTLKRA